MKQIIFIAILILAFCFAVFAQKGRFLLVNTLSSKCDEIVTADDFGTLPLKEQKARFDVFFLLLRMIKLQSVL